MESQICEFKNIVITIKTFELEYLTYTEMRFEISLAFLVIFLSMSHIGDLQESENQVSLMEVCRLNKLETVKLVCS